MPKIQKLKYHQIDFNKYDNCIDSAINSRIEAFSWYLDIVTKKNWEILVLNDYQAVLPLPLFRVKRKFFKKMVSQPLFCQQLGLFYKDISKIEIQLFMDYFKKETIFQYHFNAQNTFVNHYFTDLILKKNNYILDLHKSHTILSKNYNKNLKRNLKKAKKANLIIKKSPSFKDFKTIIKQHDTFKIKNSQYKKIEKLTKTISDKGLGNFYGAYLEEKLVTVVYFIETQTKIVYLFSKTTLDGKKNGAAAFLIDCIIQNNCNQSKTLDFEGSNIVGIAKFFKSFGAINEPYFAYVKR